MATNEHLTISVDSRRGMHLICSLISRESGILSNPSARQEISNALDEFDRRTGQEQSSSEAISVAASSVLSQCGDGGLSHFPRWKPVEKIDGYQKFSDMFRRLTGDYLAVVPHSYYYTYGPDKDLASSIEHDGLPDAKFRIYTPSRPKGQSKIQLVYNPCCNVIGPNIKYKRNRFQEHSISYPPQTNNGKTAFMVIAPNLGNTSVLSDHDLEDKCTEINSVWLSVAAAIRSAASRDEWENSKVNRVFPESVGRYIEYAERVIIWENIATFGPDIYDIYLYLMSMLSTAQDWTDTKYTSLMTELHRGYEKARTQYFQDKNRSRNA